MGKETVLPKNIRQIGDIQGTDRICLEDYVTTYIRKKEAQENQGYLGIFLGEERKEEEYVYIFIRGILEIPEEEMEDAQLLEYLKTESEKYFPGCNVQGCCVIGVYPAAKMERLNSLMPETGQLLYHLQEQEESVYRLVDGQYQRIRGYFIFYEQNPEMQEYLAQVFQEEQTEKETLPDNAIKSFREKVKEKGMQKHTGFLRLAGSFLVITVLAVGAIAVNRVDEIRTIRELSGDVTRENEVMEEDLEVLREWSDVNPVEYVTDPVMEIADITGGDTAENSAGTQISGAADEMSSLPGSDAFWADTYEDKIAEDIENAGDTGSIGDTDSINNTDILEKNEPGESTETTENIQSTVSVDSASDINNSMDIQESAGKGTGNSTEVNMGTEEKEEAITTSARQIQAVYVIRSGDTLADICNKYYGSMEPLEEICRINEISDANVVMPGQKIVLP